MIHKSRVLWLTLAVVFTIIIVLLVRTTTTNAQVVTTCALELALVVDESLSVGRDELALQRGFTKGVVDGLPFGPNEPTQARGTVVAFATSTELRTPLSPDANAIKVAIDAPRIFGNTNLTGGIDTAQASLTGVGSNPSVQDAMLIVTDGAPNDETNAAAAAANARAAGTIIFVVGVDTSLSAETFLRDDIASPPFSAAPEDQTAFFVSDFSQLGTVIDSINRNACGAASTVSGVAVDDQNSNGVQDGGEPFLEFALLQLYDAADTGRTNPLQFAVTNATGQYSFSVAPGNYKIFLNLDSGNITAGSFDAGTFETGPIAVVAGSNVAGIDTLVNIPVVLPTPTPIVIALPPSPPPPAVQGGSDDDDGLPVLRQRCACQCRV